MGKCLVVSNNETFQPTGKDFLIPHVPFFPTNLSRRITRSCFSASGSVY